MVLLPFADEIQKLVFPIPEGVRISQEIHDGARNLINALRIDNFTPGCVENPVLQKHYAAVQALALEEPAPEETADMLKPDDVALADKAPVIAAWRTAVEAGL